MIGGEWKRAGGIDKVPFSFGCEAVAEAEIATPDTPLT
jgi:hypothetical protein